MSETMETLRSKLNSARELRSVVRTMKTLAAANIGQYERAVAALADYYRAVELALAACFRGPDFTLPDGRHEPRPDSVTGAVVFGSDLGLVGRFNDHLADYVVQQLAFSVEKKVLWAVGERMAACLEEAGLRPVKEIMVPNSISAITPLITQLLADVEQCRIQKSLGEILVFRNRPGLGVGYESARQRLLPLDQRMASEWSQMPWPTPKSPEILVRDETTFVSFIREYLFVSLFRACAESLASENASRLAAMQRAERNIEDLAEDLSRAFNQARQTSIDQELFDLLGGYEALLES